jgi:hypothetical protein
VLRQVAPQVFEIGLNNKDDGQLVHVVEVPAHVSHGDVHRTHESNSSSYTSMSS